MAYRNERRFKPGWKLTEEERDVGLALKAYRFEPHRVDMFVPVLCLHRTYLRHLSMQGGTGFDSDELGIRAFGAAIRRVFPFDDEGSDPYFVRRWYNGKRLWGYLGLVGPMTKPTHSGPGKPKKPLHNDTIEADPAG